MAVQAQQYPSNLLLLPNDRGTQIESTKPMDVSEPHRIFFSNTNNGSGSVSSKKRGRETATAMIGSSTSTVGQSVHPTAVAVVSTGLRLAVDEEKPPSIFSGDLAAQMSQDCEDIDNFLHARNEQLRRCLAERRQQQYRALLSAAEETATRRLREKEAELDHVTRRAAELEDRLGRLRSESIAWKTKALAEQAAAAALHSQIQQKTSIAATPVQRRDDDECFELTADDAESAHIDPCRVEPVRERHRNALCRACGVRQVSAVLLPCRHLCLCSTCDATVATPTCPVCGCPRSGSVLVFLS